MAPEPNRAACPREKPLLAPWVSLTPDPTLFYANGRGQLVALDHVGLARLALGIAEAQAALARAALE